jgi:hypothetical protein
LIKEGNSEKDKRIKVAVYIVGEAEVETKIKK